MSSPARTMADIARLAGVSVSTVSRALADSPRLPEVTKKRIADIAGAHDYRVDLTARNFRLGNSDTVVALIPFGADSDRPISDPFYLEIIGVMLNEFSARRFDFLISRAQAGDEEWYERYVLGKRVAGLIVLGRKSNDRGIAKLRKANANFVVWGPPMRGQGYVSVGSDGVSGARQAIRHLANQGRRRIAFVGGDADATETILRQRGYVRELEDAGLGFDPNLVAYTNYTPRAARDRRPRALRSMSEYRRHLCLQRPDGGCRHGHNSAPWPFRAWRRVGRRL